jgi:ribonucleoside-diphosphate reductase alpha chain
MERVKADADWTLFCPIESYDDETGKGLMDLFGEDFNRLYLSLEAAGKGRKTVKAQHLWSRIVEAQMETGTPYMLYKAGIFVGCHGCIVDRKYFDRILIILMFVF